MSDPALVRATRRFYDALARRNGDLAFLNAGFVDLDGSGSAPPGDELALLLESCRRLYEEVLRPLPAATGRVLEVACGRGGGAAFLLAQRPELRYLGLDLSSEHVRVCRRRFADHPRARFAIAEAGRLPVPDAHFDAAYSVEAQHHFADRDQFYREVARALRPDGRLLLTGIWWPHQDPDTTFEAAGFEVVERVDVSANVVAALERTSPLRERMVDELDFPAHYRPLLLNWAAVKGYGEFDQLAAGISRYLRLELRRR